MNIEKIHRHLKICSKAIAYRISTSFHKKDPNLWLFGAWKGNTYNDNSKYMFEYVANNIPNIRAVWVTKNRNVYESVKQEYPVVLYPSKEASYLINRAGLLFQTEGYKDIGEYPVGRAKVIQLWHGSPSKAHNWFQYNSLLKTFFVRIENGDRRKQYWVSQSKFYSEFYHKSLGIPMKNFIDTGSPRCDGLMQTSSQLIDNIKNKYGFRKIVLYLPTHRNWGSDFDNNFVINGLDLIDRILSGTDICFLYKPHPNEIELFNRYHHIYTNVVIMQGEKIEEQDVYSYLAACDSLVSDYSSVIYDYLICNKPIVLFDYDIEYYQLKDGGVSEDYFKYPIGPMVKTWNEMISTVISLLAKDTWQEKRNLVQEHFNGFNSGQNCKKLADYLISHGLA